MHWLNFVEIGPSEAPAPGLFGDNGETRNSLGQHKPHDDLFQSQVVVDGGGAGTLGKGTKGGGVSRPQPEPQEGGARGPRYAPYRLILLREQWWNTELIKSTKKPMLAHTGSVHPKRGRA